jgi:cellulose synthase operon protein C
MNQAGRGAMLGLLAALALQAQTLQQAEALWKAHDYQEANNVFRALVAQSPANLDYKVRWGRMYLEHWQPDVASEIFNEVLAVRKDHPGALLGLALVAAGNFEHRAAELARQALASDPKLVDAHELLARLALEDNNDALAIDEARQALALNATSVQARAVLASIDWLDDKKDSAFDPHDASGYATVAYFFVLNRRYEDGVAYYRKALELDPKLERARSELGINLMRLGQDAEAYEQLRTCWNNGYQDTATKNSLTLMDSYKNFVTTRVAQGELRLHKKEAALLEPYFEAELARVIAAYDKKYGFTLTRGVRVEVYPDHEDFAVRTMGMPGLGALGVTFGYDIAMDSPSGRAPGTFHWGSVLWHEMSHVYTLAMTHHRVPRWFTEGLAVHEETAISPEWGDRLAPTEIMAIKDKMLLPITELDRGFIHPTYAQQVSVSYFQSGRICDYITGKWGWNTILAMLKDFGRNQSTEEVVRAELKIEPAEFDQQFLAWLEADTRKVVENFASWQPSLKQLAELSRKKDYPAVIELGLKIRDQYPDYVEYGSVYEALATAYLTGKRTPEAMAELDRYMRMGGRNPETLKQYATLLEQAGRKADAAGALERINYIYPIDGELHSHLGGLYLDTGNARLALREFRAALDLNPIDSAQAHYNLARAYRAAKEPGPAKEEVLAALEAAPSFRPAQKLLLELAGPEEGTSGTDSRKQPGLDF